MRLNERKIVKTISLKKVSAVAVASLGFGLLSVVPAQAASATVSTGTSITLSAATSTVAVGTAATTTATFAGTAVSAAACTVATAETFPSDAGAGAQGATAAAGSSLTAATLAAQATVGGAIAPTTTGTSGAWSASSVLSWTPDKPGVYTVTMTMTTAACSTNAADPAAGQPTATWTVYAGYSAGGTTNTNKAFPTQGLNIASGWTGVAGGQGTVRITNFPTSTAGTYYVTTDTGAILAGTEGDAGNDIAATALTNGTNLAGGFNFAIDSSTSASAHMDVTVTDTGSPASTTVTVRTFNATTGASSTFVAATITWGANVAGLVKASTSAATMNAAATWSSTTEATVSASRTAATVSGAITPVAAIRVVLGQEAGAITTTTAVTAAITGAGAVYLNNDNDHTTSALGFGSSISSTIASTGETFYVLVAPNGTSGVATVTITAGTYTATKTVTFYGSAASYKATNVLNPTANGVATTDAVLVCAADSAGVAVPGATIYAYSGDTTVATVETSDATEASAIVTSGTVPTSHVAATAIGCVAFDVTGLSQTTKSSVVLTFGNAATQATSTVTTTSTVNVGSVAATTVTLTTNKATYAPGEKMTVTLTFKDSAGRLVGAGVGTGTLAAALTSSASLTGDALFATANASKLGVTEITVYAPLAQGPVVFTGKTGTDATYLATAGRDLAITATATVVDANQSSLLTQIDALNAKIVALNALIAKIMKKLGVK
jgi:hypothetical protein